MTPLVIAVRVGLGALFIVGGVLKLRDRPGVMGAALGFGLPPVLAAPISYALSPIEILIGFGLVVPITARLAAIAAAAALVMFSATIANALIRKRNVDCHCFGSVGTRPVGVKTLIRNIVLVALSLVAAVSPDSGHLSMWSSSIDLGRFSTIGLLVLAIAVIVQGVVLMAMLAQRGRLLERLGGIERSIGVRSNVMDHSSKIGVLAPDFELRTLDGRYFRLSEVVVPEKIVILAFVSPRCGACATVIPALATWRDDNPWATIVLISSGSTEEASEQLGDTRFSIVALQNGHEIAQLYAVPGTPGIAVIDGNGVIVGSAVGHVGIIVELDRARQSRGSDLLIDLSKPPNKRAASVLDGVGGEGGARYDSGSVDFVTDVATPVG